MLMMLLYRDVNYCIVHAALTAANGAMDTAVGQVSTNDYSSFNKSIMSYLLRSILYKVWY
jgi:hypothetical protein